MRSRAHFKQLALSELVESIAETYRPDMDVSGHHLITSIQPDLAIIGDYRLLQQLLTNLLDNVLVHTPAGTQVHVSLHKTDRCVQLTVSDDGPGAPLDETADLFQRFTRGERSRSTPGHGLGLALVAAIVASHGGQSQLSHQPGFKLTIDLP